MRDEDALLEEEKNFHMEFYSMVNKINKMFAEYEKKMEREEKEEPICYHTSVNKGEGVEPSEPPSPYSSEFSTSSASSHHSKSIKSCKNIIFNWM